MNLLVNLLIIAKITVMLYTETIAENTRTRSFKKEMETRALANETEVVQIKALSGSQTSFECVLRCSEHPTCAAVNDFNNGSCQLVLSGQFTIQTDQYSILYSSVCPPGFGYFFHSGQVNGTDLMKSSCYKFIMDEKNWQDSRDMCLLLGGDLISIETSEEQNHIVNVINNDPTKIQSIKFWTSGSDVTQEGTWTWMATGIAVDLGYSSWGAGRPNNFNDQDCMVIKQTWDWNWNDRYCSENNRGICEISFNM